MTKTQSPAFARRARWFVTLLALGSMPACSHGGTDAPPADGRRKEPAWISGQVMGVDRIPIEEYNESTVHLIITTEGDDNVRLKLGPGWYIKERGLTFEPQQRIQFRGKPDPSDGSFVAHELRHGEQVIEFRDADGAPRWPERAPEPSGETANPPGAPSPAPAESTPAEPTPAESTPATTAPATPTTSPKP